MLTLFHRTLAVLLDAAILAGPSHATALTLLFYPSRSYPVQRVPAFNGTALGFAGAARYAENVGLSTNARVLSAVVRQRRASLHATYPDAQSFLNIIELWLKDNPEAKLVFFVRHPESASNLFGYGQEDATCSPLTPHGVKQRNFFTKWVQTLSFDRWVSSGLERTHTLIRPAAKAAGAHVEQLKLFREVTVEPMGGLSRRQMERLFPDNFNDFEKDPAAFDLPPFFSGKRFFKDLNLFFENVVKRKEERTIIASHGLTILLAVMALLGIPTQSYASLYKELGNSPYIGVTILAFHAETQTWELLVYGDNTFLPPELRGHTEDRFKTVLYRLHFYQHVGVRMLLRPWVALWHRERVTDYFPRWRQFIHPSDQWVWSQLRKEGLTMRGEA